LDPTILERLLAAGDRREDCALATIIRVWGSTPRKPGTKMLVTADGSVCGTIGGGCGEAEVRREALAALDCKSPARHSLDLGNDLAADEGMACGGKMDVFIDFISSTDQASREIFEKLYQQLKSGEEASLITITGDGGSGSRLIGRKILLGAATVTGVVPGEIASLARTLQLQTGGREAWLTACPVAGDGQKTYQVELLVESCALPDEVIILGGGHISLPLSRMAGILGYRCTVADDRPSFASRERFPGAYRIVCENFDTALKGLDIGPSTCVVIVTRGHKHDRYCLREALKRPAAYIGMIGSRRKVKSLMDQMVEEGFDPERLNSVFSPIGLDIGAETPEEIALSIMAEIVAVRRGRRGGSLKRSGDL